MLKGAMKLEQIANLMTYINGDVEDTSDDIIDDVTLYNILCRIIFTAEDEGAFEPHMVRELIDRELEKCAANYLVSGEEKLRKAMLDLKDFLDEFPAGIEGSRAYLRPIYEGKLPYDEYIKALAKAGTEYMLVEQDSCYNEDEFECLRRSYVNVTSRFPEAK